MNANTLKVLAGATVVVAVGALIASKMRASDNAASGADELVLPVLQERVNDVTSVLIESKDGTITLARGEAGWTLAEKDGYDANAGKVRDLILGLRDAHILETKTSNAKRFAKLGLEAPDAPGSSSKRVTLKAKDGEAIATLLVGNQRLAKGRAPQGSSVQPDDQFYVHLGGEAPALLATGNLRVDARTVGWMDQELMNIGRKRIQAARVTHADGTSVAAARASMDATELEALNVPEGMQAKEPNGTRPFMDALAGLRFDDVQKESEIDWSTAEITTAEFFTEHGLRTTVETVEIQDDAVADGAPPANPKVWARFRFDMAPDAEKPTLPAQEPSEEEEEEEPPASAPSPADQAKELADLQSKTKGWAYALPTWKSSAFRLSQDSIFEQIPPPELPPELQPAGDDPTTLLDNTSPPK